MIRFRKFIQAFFFLFFIYLFVKARFPLSAWPPSDIFLRSTPLFPIFDCIANLGFSIIMLPGLILWLLTVIGGRFFCGWICPLGSTLDLADGFLSHSIKYDETVVRALKSIKFIILFGSFIAAFFSMNIWGYFDPISIMNRVVTIVWYPLATLLIGTTITAFSKIPFLSGFTTFLRGYFKKFIMPEDQGYFLLTGATAIFFLIILCLGVFSRRFWCRNLCPAGAFLGLISSISLFERKVDDTCVDCGRCSRECKMDAIAETDIKRTRKNDCIICCECTIMCPTDIRAQKFNMLIPPSRTSPDFSRRRFMQTTLGAMLITGLGKIGMTDRGNTARLIRPPGSLPDERFLEKCIRCQECVRICVSNGRCLQPDGIEHGIDGLWAPKALMRSGYCEFNCNLCGQICPTGAIKKISLKEKQKFRMGMAYFDKNICIPYARNADCLVCEEHCPISEKAIQIEVKEIMLPDGSKRSIKYPYIVPDRCIGCGICEFKCPLPGNPGISVHNNRSPKGVSD